MFIKKKVYTELVNENSRLENKVKDLEDAIDFLKGKKREANELCEGCKHLITGERTYAFAKTTYYECALNRTCKDFEKGDSDENNGD
jgi:hypothetical protein